MWLLPLDGGDIPDGVRDDMSFVCSCPCAYITVVEQDEGIFWVCGGEDGDTHDWSSFNGTDVV